MSGTITPDAVAPRGPVRPRGIRALSLALLAVSVFAAFAGVLRNGWVILDDPVYVYENQHVAPGLTAAGVRWFLREPHGSNWHPLTSLSHLLDVQLFGLAPAGHHATSLALHLLNVLLLVVILNRLTGAWWRSLLVGALFGLHPLRVESVAWVAERKDVLSGLCFLLTLEAWRHWAARPGVRRYALVVVGLALGLMSKPMLVTLPFVLVLLDVWPLGRLCGGPRGPGGCPAAPARPLGWLLAEKWPLFVLAAGSAVVTFLIQRQSGAVATTANLGLPERTGNALLSYWRYVGMTLWPVALSPFYPFRVAAHPWAPGAAAAGLGAVTALALCRWRKYPWLAVGWFWYLGMLVPVVGLVQVGAQAYADRYTYLPVIGLLVAAVWAVADLLAGRRGARLVSVAAVALVLTALGVATARQVALWKDSLTLFAHARRITSESMVVEQALGRALMADSQRVAALRHLRRAVELDPRSVDARHGLGAVLALEGRLDEASQEFRRVLELQPMNPEALFNLGLVAKSQGRRDEAAALFRRALERPTDRAHAQLCQLGVITIQQGRMAEGIALLQRAVALAPADASTRVALATVLHMIPGRDAEAAEHVRQALRHAPGDVAALNALAWLLATSPDPAVRRPEEAVRLAERVARAIGGRDPSALDTQAAAEAAAGRPGAAVTIARRALELAERSRADTLAVAIRGRLASYERGRAWVDSARVAGPSPARP